LTDPEIANRLQRDRGLDPGEANAIALAIELQADDLLIDERLGRREALQFGLSIIGILGILIIAKQRNLIPTVRPVMDDLIDRAGFRVSSKLYQQVLNRSNEA
jgi:predicted nucleic acid-binding protein